MQSQPTISAAYNAQMAVESEKRWKSFAKLDTAELGWFHLRSVIVAGTGFFTDAYDIFVISQALPMIYTVYYPEYNVTFTSSYPGGKHLDAWMKASTSWGNLVGQIGFGILADKLGRKKMYGVELIIMIVCTIGSCLAAPIYSLNILVILSVWRFFLGVGIGGDYPMSAIITSEFANVQSRGFLMASVFAMQGAGILLGGIVYYATLEGMTTLIQADYRSIDIVWRLGLGIGIIPAIIALYFRLTIPETPRYTVDVIGDTNKGTSDIDMVLQLNKVKEISTTWNQDEVAVANTTTKNNSWSGFKEYFCKWQNTKTLIGTAYCWFALDVAWYSLQLNQSTLLKTIGYTPDFNAGAWAYFRQSAIGNLIIAVGGSIPGYIVCILLIERLGRKKIQIIGFVMVAILLAVLAGLWNTIQGQREGFLVLYILVQFFIQFGPNTTTFVIPGEVFPTRFRSTAFGISAAAGKAGAIIGIQLVGPSNDSNPALPLWIFAGVMLSGALATFLLPETKDKTLEELSNEGEVIIGA